MAKSLAKKDKTGITSDDVAFLRQLTGTLESSGRWMKEHLETLKGRKRELDEYIAGLERDIEAHEER